MLAWPLGWDGEVPAAVGKVTALSATGPPYMRTLHLRRQPGWMAGSGTDVRALVEVLGAAGSPVDGPCAACEEAGGNTLTHQLVCPMFRMLHGEYTPWFTFMDVHSLPMAIVAMTGWSISIM